MSAVYCFLMLSALVALSVADPANVFNIYSPEKMCHDDIVAFSVGRTTGFAPPSNAVIKMDKMLYNKGGHFDLTMSYFTAPVDGLFQFSFSATSAKGKSIYLLLRDDKEFVASVFNYNDGAASAHKQASGVAYVEMKKGEHMSLWLAGGQAIYGQAAPVTTLFSGHLMK